MPKRWRIHPHDPDRVRALERAAGVPAVVAQLLICRGIHDPALARQFLECRLSDLRPPEQLPGVPEAAERIAAAVAARRRIVIYGDYDVDGMTGAALLWQCLKLLGGDVAYYVPCRIQEGYGLNHEALRSLALQGAKMVITVDCGIASVDEAVTAREAGLELIVTDHHEMAETLPDAAVCVHPRLPGTTYPFGGLSGAGVAFKLAWAVCQQAHGARKVSEAMKNFLLQAVALAALGTVADVVPLVDENRILVRHGLTSLKNRPLLGMAALMRVAGLEGKSRLDCEDIGFTLAPRLNAAGRLGQAQLAIELLTTASEERALALAEYISELNNTRQTLERSIYLAANKQANEEFDPESDSALVLAGRGWHPGVIGIVAGRLAEKFNRPVVMIALDELGVKPGAGSARSVKGFDLHRALATCSHHLLAHGGHAAAAGLRIEERCVAAFRDDFSEAVAAEIGDKGGAPELWIDAEAPLSAFTMQTVDHLDRLAPFGQGNSRPLWCATGVNLCDPPRKIGGGERHLSLQLHQHGVKMRAVAFGGAEWFDELAACNEPLAVAFRPIINEFNGRRRVELQVTDWQKNAPVG